MKKIFENKNLLIGLIVLVVIAVGFGVYQLIPKHNVFVKVAGMHYQRPVTAVKLQDGNVLVFGSNYPKINKTAEIYYPDKNKYEVLPNEMNRSRIGATATLMQDGRVFIVGGEDNRYSQALPTAEIYNPLTKEFILIKGVKYDRHSNAASLLKDGRVLVTGGWINTTTISPKGHPVGWGLKDLDNAEIYNPKTNQFKLVKMHHGIFLHQQVTLNNGKVLVTSGSNGKLDAGKRPTKVVNAEIFDPMQNKFIMLKPMHYKHRDGTATLLNDGNVLIAGGEEFAPISHVEIFDPFTNKFMVINDMNNPRKAHSALLLGSGNVLITGGTKGYATGIEILDDAEIFDTKQNKFIELGSLMHKKRRGHQSILLNNGNVLIPDYEFSEMFVK